MKIKTKDQIVLDVIKKMDERSLVGQKKYGQTMEQEVTEGMKDLSDFLDDTQEEIMDALLYIQAAKKCLAENTKLLNIDEWKTKKVKNNDEFQYTFKDRRFFTTLPSSGVEISFKILNVNELNKIRKTIEENISLEMLESSSSLFLFSILESVAGYTDSTSLNNFVQSVPIKDSLYIRNLYSFVEPDISTKTNFNCLDCGHQEDMEVPLGVDFFWPKR